MDGFNKVIDLFSESKLITVVISIVIVYSALVILYDLFTKSEIEKKLSFQGRDRVLLGLILFIFYFFMVTGVALDQVIKVIKDSSIWIALLALFSITLAIYIIALILLACIYFIFNLKSNKKTIEVKLFCDKNEYWTIYKVTKDNRVILKKDDEYLTISDIKELDYKIMRAREVEKRKTSKREK